MQHRWLLIALAFLPLAADSVFAQATNPVEVVVVTGRVPGPPLWRVVNGERVLYIFPALSPVPEGIVWDSSRIELVLAESQEVILRPDVDADFSVTTMLNPINLIRGARLARRLTRNPDEATLEDVLPPDLLQRYEALRSAYFPREDRPERTRPLFAGVRLAERIQREEGLVSGDEIMQDLERLIRRNRKLEQTTIEVVMDFKGSFREVAERAETLVESLSPEQELACFAEQLRRVESELDAMKSRANAWAEGSIDEFRGIPLPGDEDDACLLLLNESSEFETIAELRAELDRLWLAAAERALASNASTFAILDIVELLQDDGLLARLAARGYDVRAP